MILFRLLLATVGDVVEVGCAPGGEVVVVVVVAEEEGEVTTTSECEGEEGGDLGVEAEAVALSVVGGDDAFVVP